MESSGNGMKIELVDNDASCIFAVVKLNAVQTCQALSRLGYTECSMEVFNLDQVGKKMEHKPFEFEIPQDSPWKKGREIIAEIAKEKCPEGWKPDLSFSSQGSFFRKDDKQYARTTIRRWVDK
jgi:hypothetical protein